MTTTVDVEYLLRNVGDLPAKDQNFAKSLLGQLEQTGSSSEKQWP